MILTPRAKAKFKTNKDGQKESTQHKCIFSYTKQERPVGAEKVKAKKSVKKGQVLFEDEYNISVSYTHLTLPTIAKV